MKKVVYMKNFVFGFIFVFFNTLLFSQEIIDFSQYHESKISKAAGAWSGDSPKEYWAIGSHFRSVAHFLGRQENRRDYVWFSDDTVSTIFLYNGELPPIQRGQVVVIYYKKISENFTPTFELEHIELTNEYFIIGNTYNLNLERNSNLRLRTRDNVKSDIILSIPYYGQVRIIEIGKEETIDGINSVWVKVEYNDTVGWCFGGRILFFV